jgi:hypothetical protein
VLGHNNEVTQAAGAAYLRGAFLKGHRSIGSAIYASSIFRTVAFSAFRRKANSTSFFALVLTDQVEANIFWRSTPTWDVNVYKYKYE